MSRLRIVDRDPNCVQAVRGDEVVAQARRQSAGSLWTVTLMNEDSPAPHIKISRRLPKHVQHKLLRTILGSAAIP